MKYIVVDADIINSRKNKFNKWDFEEKIKEINLLFKEDIIIDFKLIKGDELQALFTKNVNLFKLIRRLKYCFLPFELKIGIGYGCVEDETEINNVNSSWELNGEAFFKVRDAINLMKGSKGKKDIEYNVYFNTNNFKLNNRINVMYSFINEIISKWKKEVFEIIFLEEKGYIHEDIAKKLLGNEILNNVNLDEIIKRNRINITKKIQRSNWYKIKQLEKILLKMFREELR